MAAGEPAAQARASGRQDADSDPPRNAGRGGILTRRIVYADASALAKLFLDESESRELLRFVAGESELMTALIARVEVLRALRRAEVADEILARARELLGRIQLRRPSDEILTRAADLGPSSLRTLDAVHLATALDLSPPPEIFLCYDRRLAEAARSHGLAVLAPGADEVHEP